MITAILIATIVVNACTLVIIGLTIRECIRCDRAVKRIEAVRQR